MITALFGLLMYLPQLLAAGKTINSHPNSGAFWVFGRVCISRDIGGDPLCGGCAETQKSPQATPWMNSQAYSSVPLSVVIETCVLVYNPDMKSMLIALIPVGVSTGRGTLNDIHGKQSNPCAWLCEHTGSLLGAGIVLHTAFAVFGMTPGWVSVSNALIKASHA